MYYTKVYPTMCKYKQLIYIKSIYFENVQYISFIFQNIMIPFCSTICFLLQNSPQFHLEYILNEAKFLFIKYSLKAQKQTKPQSLRSGGYGGPTSKSNCSCGISMIRRFAFGLKCWSHCPNYQFELISAYTKKSDIYIYQYILQSFKINFFFS